MTVICYAERQERKPGRTLPKVLIVEDDQQLAGKMREWLEFEKFTVEWAQNGADAWSLLQSYAYDAIVLDWNLPEMTGPEICRNFRSKGGQTPVIFLTGKSDIDDKETGFDSGADDYLTKPFHVKELSARLRALMRRPSEMQPDVLRIGDLTLEPKTCKVTKAEKELKLLPKELALLHFLMRHPNQVFSSKALLDHVWSSDSDASEDTIRTYMKTLRRKITREGEECPIRTVHGLGYKIEQ